jgi:ABC-type branched-subunit amino acid transport system permease subunit
MNGSFVSAGQTRWGWFIAFALLALVLPLVTSDVHTLTLLSIWALFALSLGLMWGFAGILSFGHAAYFGLGAYTYAITAVNTGESTAAWILAILVPAAVAAVLGAMMFFGRISDVYMGVITLVFALILNKFVGATAGDAYRIGEARLGGFNGIPAFPILNVPGDPSTQIFGVGLYYVVVVCLLGCYLLSRWILASAFGRTLIGIRENEARVELLGYNAPLYKTAIFTITAAMAGLAGCLYASWAEIVTPSLFGLGQSVDVIIWVLVGGLGTLIGPILGAFGLGFVKLLLGEQTLVNNSLVFGVVLILVVLLMPRGVVPSVAGWWSRRSLRVGAGAARGGARRRRAAAPAEAAEAAKAANKTARRPADGDPQEAAS